VPPPPFRAKVGTYVQAQGGAHGCPGDVRPLDEELVASCATWFEPVEEAYRGAGAIAARPPVPGDADAQTLLLARFGRRA